MQWWAVIVFSFGLRFGLQLTGQSAYPGVFVEGVSKLAERPGHVRAIAFHPLRAHREEWPSDTWGGSHSP